MAAVKAKSVVENGLFTARCKDLFVRKDGQIFIYVINHKTDLSGESVEKFEFRNDKDQIE